MLLNVYKYKYKNCKNVTFRIHQEVVHGILFESYLDYGISLV